MFAFALRTLWFERKRYWAGVLAVAFSAVLIAVQVGLMIGLMAMVSFPVDVAPADVWLAAAKVPSCDLGAEMNRDFLNRLVIQPEVAAVDEYIQGFAYLKNPKGGKVLVIVAGADLSDDSLGPVHQVPRELRLQLSEPGAILVNENDKGRLGLDEVGDTAEIINTRVRVAGFVRNMGSFTGPYLLCSLRTARQLLMMPEERSVYLLAKTRTPEQAPRLAQNLRAQYGDKISAFTAKEFSNASRWYWIINTRAGLAVGFVAILGLVVGAVITSQTLYAATMSSLRELMVLRALGVPRWRMNLFVLAQAALVGVLGLAIGFPTSFVVVAGAEAMGIRPILPPELLAGTAVISLSMAMLAGFVALRSLAGLEPANLLR